MLDCRGWLFQQGRSTRVRENNSTPRPSPRLLRECRDRADALPAVVGGIVAFAGIGIYHDGLVRGGGCAAKGVGKGKMR